MNVDVAPGTQIIITNGPPINSQYPPGQLIQSTPTSKIVTTTPTSVSTVVSVTSVGDPPPVKPIITPDVCQVNTIPWPMIIISIIGAIIVIYTAVAPNIDETRRVFGVVFTILWTLIWAIILWVLWRECYTSMTWWLLLLPTTLIILFWIAIIIFNAGSSL